MSGGFLPVSEPAPHARAFYRRALLALQAAQVPFLVGGGYALAHYTGIMRCGRSSVTQESSCSMETPVRSTALALPV